VPKTLRPIIRIPEANASKTRTFTLGMTGGMGGGGMMGGGTGGGMGSMQFTINGLSYDHMHVEADPCLGSTEIWEFVNPMMMDHPMHAHAGMYQILDRNGVRPPAWEMGWKDVWLVRAGEKVRVIGTFNDYACDPDMMADLSNYMIHCHILEHDDNGMMTQFKVMPM
jgi:FtsP/CotA-like multicopper oxidase with cupredoxin domain